MASHVVVIDSSFRRANIKVTPGMYIADILEQACQKFGLQSTQYDLKMNQKSLDLTRTFRQSGLAAGSKLEIVLTSRSPTTVSVALHLPTILASVGQNSRLTEKFSNDTTLWLILRRFESTNGANLNLTARGVPRVSKIPSNSAQLFYEMPVLNVAGRELSTFGDLQKTLRQLGVHSGSCLIKLDFKQTEQQLEKAFKRIQDYFETYDPVIQDKEIVTADCQEISVAQLASLGSSDACCEGQKEMLSGAGLKDTSNAESVSDSSDELIKSVRVNLEPRPITVYAPPSTQILKAATIPHDDTDFEPTVAHAKLHQNRLQSSSQNKRLLSDAEIQLLEHEKVAKLANLSKISIKVRFPDQSTIVSSFGTEETGKTLYIFTKNAIVNENEPFKLTWHNKGPQTIPNNDMKLLKDIGLVDRVLINFSWTGEQNYNTRKTTILKPHYIQNAKEIHVPTVPVDDITADNMPTENTNKNQEKDKPKVVGKWFKGLAKKKNTVEG